MRSFLSRRAGVVTLVAAVVAVPLGLGGPADGTGSRSGKMTPFEGNLTGVTASSADSAWAVGYQTTGDDVLLEHWDGRSWKPQKHPRADSSAAFLGVSASSASDVWAVGSHYIGPADGRDTGPPYAELTAVAAVSPKAAFALGRTDVDAGEAVGFIQRRDGRRWKLY